MQNKSEAVIAEILAERLRQMSSEGWSVSHDDEHSDRELAWAAASYALYSEAETGIIAEMWPWNKEHWDKMAAKTTRRRLVIAASLIVAEIERLDRAETPASIPSPVSEA